MSGTIEDLQRDLLVLVLAEQKAKTSKAESEAVVAALIAECARKQVAVDRDPLEN